jgi:hypothetical protein
VSDSHRKLMVVALVAAATLMPGWGVPLEAAPVTIHPGDAAVDGRIIKPYRNSWRLVGRGADGSVVQMGIWSDNATIGTIDGREVIFRRQIWIHEKGAEGYFNVVDHRTLAPVLSQYTNAGGFYRRMEYGADGRTVRYQYSPMPAPESPGTPAVRLWSPMKQGEIATAAPSFDFNTGMFGLLIAGFPLKEGYSARFPVFKSYDPGVEPAWIDFVVKGKEEVPAGPGKTLDTWLVIANSPDTQEVMRFNLILEPPYIIRLRQEWEGRDWTFEMM